MNDQWQIKEQGQPQPIKKWFARFYNRFFFETFSLHKLPQLQSPIDIYYYIAIYKIE